MDALEQQILKDVVETILQGVETAVESKVVSVAPAVAPIVEAVASQVAPVISPAPVQAPQVSQVPVSPEANVGDVVIECLDFILANWQGHDAVLKQGNTLRSKLQSAFKKIKG